MKFYFQEQLKNEIIILEVNFKLYKKRKTLQNMEQNQNLSH